MKREHVGMSTRTSFFLATVALLVVVLPAIGCSKDQRSAPVGGPTRRDNEKPTTFNSEVAFEVFLWDPEDWTLETKLLGTTPCRAAIEIPPGRRWFVSPQAPVDMQKVREEVMAKKIPGLRFYWTAMIDDNNLAHLAGLVGLQRLDLWSCQQITDAGLAHLKGLTGLQALNLRNCDQITDAGLAHLQEVTGLQALFLYGCTKITDAGLGHLKEITGLQVLSLDSEQITDAGLAHLKGLTGLQSLRLYRTQMTDAGLAHLNGLTELRERDLRGCKQITDAGLAHLKGLTGLQELILEGTQVTEAGVRKLQKSLPNTDISIHGRY